MTTQKEALKLALEALYRIENSFAYSHPVNGDELNAAIESLSQAIATEESSNAANAAATQRSASEHLEPVAKPTCSDERPCLPCYLDQGKCSATQEPAYWLGYGLQAHTEKPFEGAAPLYTRPQPKAEQEPKREWVGLTDEEIMDVAFNFDVPSISLRTIEAKLKEKNT